MSGLLYGAGAIAVMVGVAMVGYGIPINEFSFGNTLIGAGTTAAVGGLIVMGLGVVVAQLQRMHEALATRTPIKASRQFDTFDNAAGARNAPVPGRIPFPSRPRTEAATNEPHPFEEPHMDTAASLDSHADEPRAATSFAPTLRNPEEPPVTVEDEVSLSPPHPMTPAPRVDAESGPNEDRYEPKLDTDWRLPQPLAAPASTRPPQPTYFDTMWPAETKTVKEPAQEPFMSPLGTETKYEAAASPGWHAEPEAPMPRPASEPRSVAILKSGVVDGMGYTLYVDGSIEAELPQGTLRFGSIDELRSHLEKNS
jgi:hypothetical protein